MTAPLMFAVTSGPALEPSAEHQVPLLAAFDCVSTSKAFRRAHRLLELLRFVVDSTLAGSKLDQTSIANAVFGKPADFDCNTDPLVRVQFSRLRLRLHEYYATEGASDAFQIVIKPRGYGASVEPNGHTNAESQDGPIEHHGPIPLNDKGHWQGGGGPPNPKTLAVLPFVNLTNSLDNDVFCHGLTD